VAFTRFGATYLLNGNREVSHFVEEDEMNEPNKGPALYSFKTEESRLVPLLCKAVRALLSRPTLPAREVHLCAVLLRTVERFPLVTDGVGLSLSLVYRGDGGNSSYMDATVRDGSFELSEGASYYSPDVGSDHENRTVIEIGVGWREGNVDLVELEDWIVAFAEQAANPEIEVSFEDFGDRDPNWHDDSDGEEYWEHLDSDYA
jgi:hypothetical protein